MNKEFWQDMWKKHRVWVTAAIGGMLAFLAIYGIRVLDVTYDDWLLTGGDLSQHYLGWCFFRESDWTFPIGLMDRIAYPNQVSVIFTDSIPILAVFFKLFRGLLPETFQYFGIWGLLCFAAQGALGAALIRHYTRNDLYSVIGSLFFVIAPIEVYRMFMHTALGGQWLLLAAFLLGVKRKSPSLPAKAAAWSALGFVCSGVHLYFVPMCGLIMCAFLLKEFLDTRRLSACLITGAGFCICALGNIVLLGGLSHDHQLDAGGLGQFSFNLNGLVNPQGWSATLPDLPCYGEGAGEGLAFLGIGILLSLLLGITGLLAGRIVFHRRISWKELWKKYDLTAYAVIAFFSVLISVSHRLPLGDKVIWEIPYPEKLVSLWGMFRSSGRFIWPLVYLLMVGALVLLWKSFHRKNIAMAIAAFLFCIQLLDSSAQYRERHSRFAVQSTYRSVLADDIWQQLAGDREHLVFVSDITADQGLLYSLSVYALENHMTINNFYFAHSAVKSDVEESVEESLANLSEDTIYIYKEADREKCTSPEMTYIPADGIIIGLKRE